MGSIALPESPTYDDACLAVAGSICGSGRSSGMSTTKKVLVVVAIVVAIYLKLVWLLESETDVEVAVPEYPDPLEPI
jgi:hypothetical protein